MSPSSFSKSPLRGVRWIRRFILFHDKRHPCDMGAPEVQLRAPFRYRFAVTGVLPSQYDIVLEGDTVRMEPAGTTGADVRCHCDAETFVLLMYGRLTSQTAVASGRLVVKGPREPMPTFGPWFKFA